MIRILSVFLLLFGVTLTIPWTFAMDRNDGDTNRFRDRVEAKLDEIIEALDDVNDRRIVCNVSIDIGEVNDATEKKKRSLSEDTVITLVAEGQPSMKIVLELPQEFGACLESYKDKPLDLAAAEVTCLRETLWGYAPDISEETKQADQELLSSLGQNVVKRSEPKKHELRVRKEYRVMSGEERHRFHTAMKKLFKNGTVAAFGRIHSQTSLSAHRGVAFLPWHRIFITKFEDALREFDDTVTLPYWDCTIDRAMEHPGNSVLWTGGYFGNMAGNVVTGFAKGWTSAYGKLHRFCGEVARLPSREDFEKLMKHCHIKDVSYPYGTYRTFEQYHNDVHAWVGGDMSAVGTAAYDPMFYFMHAFIDYKWEVFRRHQREECGVDPTTDYPHVKGHHHSNHSNRDETLVIRRKWSSHRAEDTMDGMPDFRNIDGISDHWTTDVYTYAPSPSCEDNCGGSDLMYCDESINYCVSKSRFDSEGNLIKREKEVHSAGEFLKIATRSSEMVPRKRIDLYQISPRFRSDYEP